MAENRINIVVGAATEQAQAKLQGFVRGVESGFRQLADGIRLGLGIDIAGRMVNALGRVPEIIEQSVRRGVQFNQTIEDSRLGIAAVLKQFDPVRFGDFNDALNEAGRAIDVLKEKAKESPATFQQLVAAFQAISGAAMSARISLQQQVDLTVIMSQALAGLGIRSEQIIQESRALLTGNINEDAQAARILGITREMINQAREQGRLYEFLTEKLSAFQEAGRVGTRNLTTVMSNFQDVLDQVFGELAKPVFEALRRGFQQLTETFARSQFKEDLEGMAARIGTLTAAGLGLANFAAQHIGVIADLFQGLALAVGAATAALVAFYGVGLLGPLAGLQRLTLALPVVSGLAATLGIHLGSLNIVLRSLAGWVGIVGAGFAGWSLGKAIGEVEVFGVRINQVVQVTWLQLFGVWERIKNYFAGFGGFILGEMTIAWERILNLFRTKTLEAARLAQKIPFAPTIDTTGLERAIAAGERRIEDLRNQQARQLEDDVQTAADRLERQKRALLEAQSETLFGPRPRPVDPSEDGSDGGQIPGQAFVPNTSEAETFLAQINRMYREATLDRLSVAEMEHQERLRRLQQEVKDVEEFEIAKRQLTEIYAAERVEIEREATAAQVQQMLAERDRMEAEYQARLLETNNLFEVGSIRQIEALARNTRAARDYREKLVELLDVLVLMASFDPELPGIEEEILRIEQTLIRLKHTMQDESFFGTLRRELRNLSDEWGAIGRNMAQVMSGGVRSAVNGVTDGIMGMIEGTMTWGQVFANVARGIIADLIRAVVQWVIQMTVIRGLRKIMDVEQVASAGMRAAAEAPAAAAASIGSFGAAATIGIGALLAGLAVGIAAFATGGMVRGPGGPTEDRVLARLSNKEYVVRAAATERYGEGFMDLVNSAALSARDLGALLLGGMEAPVTAGEDVAAAVPLLRGGGAGSSPTVNVSPTPVNFAVLDSPAKVREFLRSNEGRQMIGDAVAAQKLELGMEA